MTNDCTATFIFDYDSLWCNLLEGHAGPHRLDVTIANAGSDHGSVWWQKERT